MRNLSYGFEMFQGEFDEDDDVEFDSSNNEGIGLMMQMSYNHSIPVDALRGELFGRESICRYRIPTFSFHSFVSCVSVSKSRVIKNLVYAHPQPDVLVI